MSGRRGRWQQIGAVAVSVAAVVAVMAVTLVWSGKVHAATNCNPGDGDPYVDYGRFEFCGYFVDGYDNFGTRLWNGGVPANVPSPASNTALQKAQDFITWVENNRNSLNLTDRTSGEFVIDTMEGDMPPNNGRGLAWTQETDWENRILKGIRGGTLAVQYFYNMPWQCGQENTFYQPPENDVAFYITSPATMETPACGPGVHTPAIRFYDPNTNRTIFTIKRNCGNPVGNLSPLPEPSYNITLTANFQGNTVGAGYGGPRFQVVDGTTYALGSDVKNNGPVNADPGDLQVDWAGAVARPCAGTCNLTAPQMTQLTGGHGGALHEFRPTAGVAGAGGPDWYWNVPNALRNGQATSGSLEFTPTGAPGTTFDLDVWYAPGDDNGATLEVKVPFVIVSERSPGVVGVNGDVHAGGGFCELPLTNPGAFIKGAVAGNSGGQYVVSASGAVGDFASNGTGADTLKLGANGNYAQVCRPDLYTLEAQPYCAAGVGLGTLSAAVPAVIQTLNPAESVFCVNGGTLKLSGNVTRKITIVATGGANIEINGNIILGGAAGARSDVPSLGIISANNITIDAAATQVDAYLFADNDIDTCVQADATCSTELLVNGFLMGKNLLLHRLGARNTNNPSTGEDVVLNPEIYLNPPKFFDASVDNIELNGLGERQPLF